MDVFADTLLNDALRPLAKTLASEEADHVIAGSGDTYSIAFDPLDGSSNVAVSLPTGTIFGVFKGSDAPRAAARTWSRPDCLYSSSCEFVVATVDDGLPRRFLDGIMFRGRGDARGHLQGTILQPQRCARTGLASRSAVLGILCQARQDPAGTKYSSRYVCALVAGVHGLLSPAGGRVIRARTSDRSTRRRRSRL